MKIIFKMKKLLLVTITITALLNSDICAVKFSSDAIIDLPFILNEGKQQLMSIEIKAKTPLYGKCWAIAISNLEVGCRALNEETQSVLALRLTDCFLQTSGHGPILCEVPRQECLQLLSDRAFNAYTEFYTHTQSICYFLQSKVWHEETERAIDKLAHTSMKVTSQLVDAEKSQALLLQHQKESLQIQQSLAYDLFTSRETINIMMNDIKISAEEQKAGLSTLFTQLSELQSWVIGEVSWMDSLLFYSSTSLVIFLLTSTPSTQPARLILLSLLAGNYASERYIITAKSNDVFSTIFEITDDIRGWVWFCRKVIIVVSAAILLIIYISFKDYNKMNHKLLLDIKKQNDDLKLRLKILSKNDSQIFEEDQSQTFAYAIPLSYKKVSPLTVSPQMESDANLRERILNQENLHKPVIKIHRRFTNSIDVESNASSEASESSLRRSLRLRK